MMLLLVLSLWLGSSMASDPVEFLPSITIQEHSAVGEEIITLKNYVEKTPLLFRFLNSNQAEIRRYFSLNSSTGEIRLIDEIDRETICVARRVDCRLILKVFELFHEQLFQIDIEIEDINDHWPRFDSTSTVEFHFSENSPAHQTKIYLPMADDQDEIDQRTALKYELRTKEKYFPFQLQSHSAFSDRLALILIDGLDRESVDSYRCTLLVRDAADHQAELEMNIVVDDVNDHSPIFQQPIYSVELSEKSELNSFIVDVKATDEDIGQNGQIHYRLSDASKQYENLFSIDSKTGRIELRSGLDFEQRSSFLFYVEAEDFGQERRSSQCLINITVIDSNDCFPAIEFRFLDEITADSNGDEIQISELYPVEKFFVQILVTDQDSRAAGNVHLQFFTEENVTSFYLYRLDSSTFFFNRTKPFDFEVERSYRIRFYAEDSDPEHRLATNKTLTINVIDENDHRPEFVRSSYHFSVKENNLVNVTLAQIEAFDFDEQENGRISYSILTNQTSFPFEIEQQTGRLILVQSLDREQTSFYQFEILAEDHGKPVRLSSIVSVRVDVEDLNDHAPEFQFEQYEFYLSEDFSSSNSIGSVRADDADFNSTLFYRIYPPDDNFQIDAHGNIYLRSSVKIDRERQDRHDFLVQVSDGVFQRSVSVMIHIFDVNDCQPQWKIPSINRTVFRLNKDLNVVGKKIFQFYALDRDDPNNGNGLVRYSLENNYRFLILTNDGDLFVNTTPSLGRYLLRVQAKDHGLFVQHSSLIELDFIVVDNRTHEIFVSKENFTFKHRLFLLMTFSFALSSILVLLIGFILVCLCRYNRTNRFHQTLIIDSENQLIDSPSSTSSKLSLDDLQRKRLLFSSSSPSCLGTDFSTIHHQISSPIKPIDNDLDSWNDYPKIKAWSTEKLLHPREKSGSLRIENVSPYGKRRPSSNSSSLPKQVRFLYNPEHIRSYPQLSIDPRRDENHFINADVYQTFI